MRGFASVQAGYRRAAFPDKVAAAASEAFGVASPVPSLASKQPGSVRAGPKLPPLLPHQKAAIDFIQRSGGSGLISHPTGAGKSRTGAEVGRMLRAMTGGRTLYVTPASLKHNMAKSIDQWSPGTRRHIVSTGKDMPGKDFDAAVTSYEIFKKRAPDFAKAGFDSVVFDEFHKAKDPNSGNYKYIRDARPLFKHYVGMTASLNSLRPTDMLQPIEAITGGKHDLGDEKAFSKRYLMTRGGVSSIFSRMRMDPSEQEEVIGFRHGAELGAKLRKYVHYVSPEDLDPELFPKKDVQTVRVDMSKEQAKLYRYALQQLPPGVQKSLHSQNPSGFQVSELYNHLIQSRALSGGVHTMLHGMSLSDSARLTPKAAKALDDVETHLTEVPDGKVVITTNLVKGGVDVLAQGLRDRGIAAGVFMGKGKGGTPENVRQQALRDLNEGKLKVLLVSQAGHEGIDVPDATMVASYDGHFNPEHVLQAEARGVRAGGQGARPQAERRVIVRRYVSVVPQSHGLLAAIKKMLGMQRVERSVDEKIYDIANKRHKINQGVFDLMRDKKPGEDHEL